MKHIYQIVKNTANQIESEFVPLLEIVSSISPRNFMEIGTDRGGTFLAFEKNQSTGWDQDKPRYTKGRFLGI